MFAIWLMIVSFANAQGGDVNATFPSVQGICDSLHSVQCYGDDLTNIGYVNDHEACCQACEAHAGCNAWTWNWQHGKNCYLKSACSDRRTSSAYHSGVAAGPPGPTPAPTPSPPPTPPTPPTPGGENPLNIQPNSVRSNNFFFIIGDWGAPSGKSGGCQRKIAGMMRAYASKQQGKKLLFVGNVGDSFYYTGLNKDSKESQFQRQWKSIYGSLTDVPWLGVYGNHDHGSSDPGCACGKGCTQFNSAGRPDGAANFWIPDYYWHYLIPEIKLEVVGLDTNAIDVNGLGGGGCKGGAGETCKVCGGTGNIQNFLSKKKSDGEAYMDQRARDTPATTVAILQHYPNSNIPKAYKERFEQKNGNKAKVLSAFGHAHDQQCYGSKERGCDIILTGGGGGYIDHGTYLGFTAVHLTDDGGFHTVMETSETRFPRSWCSWLAENSTEVVFEEEIRV